MEAESELDGFVAKFAPEMQSRIRGCRAKLQARFPSAVQLVALDSPEDLDRPELRALIHASLELASTPMEEAEGPLVIIQSVSAKQRPRR